MFGYVIGLLNLQVCAYMIKIRYEE